MSKKTARKNAAHTSTPSEWIVVKGARTHNLKNITVEMPRNSMVVFTGLSGSGKSSLAFDTIFAEGQRRYVESLSAYARQFLNTMQKPDVDEIVGLSPAISIDQKSASRNPRSTVATVTEIYDYLRVLYARLGRPHCLICDREIEKLAPEEMLLIVKERVEQALADAKMRKQNLIITAPVVRGRKGEYYQFLYNALSRGFAEIFLDGQRKSLRERVLLSKNKKHTIDFIVDELPLEEFKKFPETSQERLSEAVQRALEESEGLVDVRIGGESVVLSAKFSCPYDGFSYPEVEPRLFSFNSPYGACAACNGLGTKHFFGTDACEVCHGTRLREEALHVKIGGKNIVEVTAMMTEDAKDFLDGLKLTARERQIASVVLREVGSRLQFLLNVGLNYLTLDRRGNTLSGGEAQRIRLASQLGSQLVGALYVLDEPTVGLHQRDNDRLIETLKALRNLGNTIIIVEHDEDTIYASDYIVDIGPGAGVHGGEIVVSGYLDDLLTADTNQSQSLTLAYLRGEEKIAVPVKRRSKEKGALKIRGGNLFNIRNMNVDIPLGRLNVITGVSGSGKSTLLYEIIHKNLQARFDRRYKSNEVFHCASFAGSEYLSRSVLIDQSPIGRTPRSNPATYTGAFTHIRDLFAASEEARVRGWKAGRFSFNRPGGRCETCEGNGFIAVEMHFLPTVYVPCDVCGGKRFTKETLEVRYKHKNIYEVLEMTIEEAFSFFADIPAIADRLKTLNEVGLGYLKLGQSATTLSGGEAQRVKISSELYRPHIERTIYLLDEPTIGLHYEDVKKLIEILESLVAKGNTVIVIEHNMDFIKSADYIIDIGPEGGAGGGKIVAVGTPEAVAQMPRSYTGQYLKRVLKKK
ncbi:MAG: excinuclease ABC subunit UvrA [Candidatus Moraniibacteriota bacterium]